MTLTVIEGGQSDALHNCLKEIRQLCRDTESIDGQKDINVMDILYIIHKYGVEDDLLNKPFKLNTNTTINLRMDNKQWLSN